MQGRRYLGSGVEGSWGGVAALAVSGGNLYVGGNFTRAGGKISPFVARAVISVEEPPRIVSPRFLSGAFGFSFSGEAQRSYIIQQSSNLMIWTDLETITPGSGAYEWTAPDPQQEHSETIQR